MWKSGYILWRQKTEIAQGCQGSTHHVLEKHTLKDKFQPTNADVPNLFVLKTWYFPHYSFYYLHLWPNLTFYETKWPLTDLYVF